MKKIIYSFLLIGVFFSSSCKKDFLKDVDNNSVLTRQNYVVDLKTTDEYMLGTTRLIARSILSTNNTNYLEVIADDIKPIVGADGRTPFGFHYSWAQMADDKSLNLIGRDGMNANGMSYDCYSVVRSCNFVIESAEKFKDQNPALASSILSQAYGIRAYAHLMLANIFAQQYNFTATASHPGVAYVTTSNITIPTKRRNTVAEVYQNLVSDLEKAISLSTTELSPLYFNKRAAKALLARVYLNMGNYTQAKNLARDVISEKPLMIANYPAKLFTLEETEAIFQTSPAPGLNFASRYFRSSILFRATRDIAELLNEDPNDKRKIWVAQQTGGEWNIVKYPSGVVAGITAASSYYPTMIRSSEMYLIAAECYANLNRLDSAQYFVDQIRLRANPASSPTTVGGTDLLDVIYKERRKELAFEGFRMFDLLRWKKPVVRVDALSGSPKVLPYPNNKAIAPIPGLDVKLGLEQNTGY